ncbi:MAG TPA: MFS transporter [Nocardioides sp.]|nr:MFS transporter [Nocardioides sp.]
MQPHTATHRPGQPEQRAVRRLRPLRVALTFSGVAPWVPVEKVFMTQLGFTPGLVALMAAAYAAVVPVLEIPSGLLADRWSRRGVLMMAEGAALVSVVIGALSHSVGTYVVSAMVLGAYFALSSGTVDAIVYDVLVEESVDSERFEHVYGRMQLWGSAALTASALAGGLVAALLSPRATYVVTVPFVLLGIVVLGGFREPTVHRSATSRSIRAHLAETAAALRGPGLLAPVIGSVAAAAALQMVFEFGPLWLVALHAPAALFGVFTAAVTATLGLGAALAARLHLGRRPSAVAALVLMTGGVLLVARGGLVEVVAGQIVMALLLVAMGVHFSRLVHDAVASSLRSGVSSGVGTLSWVVFLPCALIFGGLSSGSGLRGGAIVLGGLVLVAGLAVVLTADPRPAARAVPEAAPVLVGG